MKPRRTFAELGEAINEGGRSFKGWFTDFTLVFSPILIVFGLMLTGVDLFLNLGISNNLVYRVLWSLAQLFAVDGLWFAVWNRILTDEYRWRYIWYHGLMIVFGVALTLVAIIMTYIVFTQDYLSLKNSSAAMEYLGIPIWGFLLTRSGLLMLTATMAIVLDKVMRTKKRYRTTPAAAKVSTPAAQVSVIEQPMSTPALSEHAMSMNEPLMSTGEHTVSINEQDEPLTRAQFMLMLTQNGLLSLKELSVSTGIAYSTLTRWKRELISPINVVEESKD